MSIGHRSVVLQDEEGPKVLVGRVGTPTCDRDFRRRGLRDCVDKSRWPLGFFMPYKSAAQVWGARIEEKREALGRS